MTVSRVDGLAEHMLLELASRMEQMEDETISNFNKAHLTTLIGAADEVPDSHENNIGVLLKTFSGRTSKRKDRVAG